MYERSAVILEKYFAQKFYYKDKNNVKNNYDNYCELIEILEQYQEISEEEDKIINECEKIADKIKQIQKNQNSLYKKQTNLQEERNNLFENIDESAEELEKQLDKIEKEIEKNYEQMRPSDKEFVDALAEFNEKSVIRSEYAKKRRKIEKEYRNSLEKTVSNINEIDPKKISEIKKYIVSDNTASNEELKDIMIKNGEKEKIPFDLNVIDNSIIFAQSLYKQEARLLVDVYEKTNNLIDETNNNSVKIKRYKKISKDSKNKVKFINVEREYLTQFLDNERLTVSLGKKEHEKLMIEACNNFKQDTAQINNLNEILFKEIAKKATQKMYRELYSPEYLKELQNKEKEFENKLNELNLSGKILNPTYWRVESIEKVYVIFDDIVSQEYERDLSKFKIIEEPEVEEDEDIMSYYDNLAEETTDNQEDIEKSVENEKKEERNLIFDTEDDDEDEDDSDFEIYEDEDDSDFNDSDDENEDDNDEYDTNEDEDREDDGSEDNDSDFDDEEDNFTDDEENDDEDDDYEDIDIILQNRKKILGKNWRKKEKNVKKKGIFGFGAK